MAKNPLTMIDSIRNSGTEDAVDDQRYCQIVESDPTVESVQSEQAARETAKINIKNRGEMLFLVEVALMFTGLVLVAEITWFWIAYHIVVVVFVIFVLWFAWRAAKVIPPSIPLQRPIGVALFVSAHIVQALFPVEMPMALVGFVMCAGPFGMLFLFEP